ncbi:hypothetical protein GCM10009525_04280 [Streptosporangium amethystogenes subsp. fukuiense]
MLLEVTRDGTFSRATACAGFAAVSTKETDTIDAIIAMATSLRTVVTTFPLVENRASSGHPPSVRSPGGRPVPSSRPARTGPALRPRDREAAR